MEHAEILWADETCRHTRARATVMLAAALIFLVAEWSMAEWAFVELQISVLRDIAKD